MYALLTERERFALRRDFYLTNEWKLLAEHAKHRAGWRCEECGWHQHLDAHHIVHRTVQPELAMDLDNLEVLCRCCHAKRHRWLYVPPAWRRIQAANDAQMELDLGQAGRCDGG